MRSTISRRNQPLEIHESGWNGNYRGWIQRLKVWLVEAESPALNGIPVVALVVRVKCGQKKRLVFVPLEIHW